MEALGRGRLSIVITDYELSAVTNGDGGGRDGFKWITFAAEACVPVQDVAGQDKVPVVGQDLIQEL